MRSKPIRKNAHKERLFSQRQNIQDFEYIKNHQMKVDGEFTNLCEKKECGCSKTKESKN